MAQNRSSKPGPPSGPNNRYQINLDSFKNHLQSFYTSWQIKKSELWANSDAISVSTPPSSEDLRYLKSSAMNIWLLGYEFPETIMVFTQNSIHFICSPKKARLLDPLKKITKEAVSAELIIHTKSKNDDGTARMDEILNLIKSKNENPTIGHVSKEAPEGKLLETWSEKLAGSACQLADISAGISEIISVKDSTELTCVRKAAYLTTSVMKNFVVPKLENVIDDEKKVSHSVLMDLTEKAIQDPVRVKVKLKSENVDICYPPIFQSGAKFDLRPSAQSNEENLYYDSTSVIICAIGSRYNSYCTNVARSFIVDGLPTQLKAYETLLKAHEAAINMIKPGEKLSTGYEAAVNLVRKESPELLPNLTKSAGTGTGLEFRESGLNLNLKSEKIIKAGMVFNVHLGFQNLSAETKNPKTKKYSLLLADTVIITETGNQIATGACSKASKDVTYSFNEEERETSLKRVRGDANGSEDVRERETRPKEELRRRRQAELARQKNDETARRLAGAENQSGGDRRRKRRGIAYECPNEMPWAKELAIEVDQKNEAVLLPVYGSMVPFHVSTVKSANDHQDNSHTCTLKIVFNVPGTACNPHGLKFQDAIYLKEIMFHSKDARHSSEVVQQIKTLQRQVASRELKRAERATLVTQEELQLLPNNRLGGRRLRDLWIRPSFGGRGRKLRGTLEAHVNGFSFSTSRPDEKVDVMYNNIKHAFFQPAEKEMITILHFHLHNHIMAGTKKTKDVQFYVEVMDVVQTLGGGRRSALDPDEIDEEQRERERKNRINMEFQKFVNSCHGHWGQEQFRGLGLEFDQPLRELGFHGVPYKAAAFIIPTSTCLVELVETPFLVVTLSEIEIVNLERVWLGQKNFDMAVVFKDFKKDVLRIDSIPCSSLDAIKEWLYTTDIKYYESKLNLNWRPILNTIIEDPESFIEDGGWDFLNEDAGDGESDEEESDKGYEPSDVEMEESESESDSESLVESEDEDEDEEEKGKTWEQLEREASDADREQEDESDSEEERRRRKKKGGGGGGFSEGKGGPSSKRPRFC